MFIKLCFFNNLIYFFKNISPNKEKLLLLPESKNKILTMKKAFLFLLMAFFMSLNFSKAQTPGAGTDFIICIDNSASIGSQAYEEMRISAKKLIEKILACNPKNRVSVVHYGTALLGSSPSHPIIYIESDFTNNIVTAQSFVRRLDVGDHFHEALGLVGNALDGTPNPDIVSPQTTLHRDPSNSFVFILFTDAGRAGGDLVSGSYLVNYYDTTYADPAAFKNVTVFKRDRKTKFAVVHVSYDSYSTQAAASIASAGGSYFGTVENNTDDPDFGISPRLYFGKPSFLLTPDEITEITKGVCENSGGGNIEMYYEPNDCGGFNTVQSVFGTYDLPAGATFIGLNLSIVSLTTGDEYPVSYNPTLTPPNGFWQWMTAADFSSVPPSALTGQFKFLLTLAYEVGGQTYYTSSWNTYPFFSYDINFDCMKGVPSTPLLKQKNNNNDFKLDRNADPNHYKKNLVTVEQKLQLTPNPTNGMFKVVLNKGIETGKLQVLDLNGNTVYNTSFNNEKEVNVDLHSQKEGIYLVKIVSDKNITYTEKIIKR